VSGGGPRAEPPPLSLRHDARPRGAGTPGRTAT
jgi:hypothetical protein